MPKTLDDFVQKALEKVSEVTIEQVQQEIGNGVYLILDVREADEFEAGHLPNAVHAPRGFVEVRADLHHPLRDPMLEDRSQRIICYCGSGNRSALAAAALAEMGFDNPLSMAGGYKAWVKSNFEVENG